MNVAKYTIWMEIIDERHNQIKGVKQVSDGGFGCNYQLQMVTKIMNQQWGKWFLRCSWL